MAELKVLHRLCPGCGRKATGEPYDIGDGPEFACGFCEWCWGAQGQALTDKPNQWARQLCADCGRNHPTGDMECPYPQDRP